MKSEALRNKKIALLLAAIGTVGSLVGCAGNDQAANNGTQVTTEKSDKKETIFNYQVTEEGINFKMTNAPVTPAWKPNELLEANLDEVALYNRSSIPLKARISKDRLSPVNSTQKLDTEIVALSIMNSSTSGNIPHGTNQFDANTFSYWQYIDQLVYWGGSAGEGLIVPPTPDVTDSAHKNGVPVLGTIFFPPVEYGGKTEWVDDFLQRDDSGKFIIIDKLIETCDKLGFDGWFINQETQLDGVENIESYVERNQLNDQETQLEQETQLDEASKKKAEYAALFQEFLKQFREATNNKYEIMWYDAMTVDGEMDWQNQMNDKNKAFVIDEEGNELADSMFLNFWWTNDKLAPEELLKKSNEYAQSVGFNPKKLFAGIDMQANGTGTPIKWNLLENGDDPFVSIGLYCPSWSFFSAEDINQFHDKESRIYVNEFQDPSKDTEAEGTEWRGLSKFAVEKSVVNSAPFTTNFNMGNGYNFFIKGEKVSNLDWNNRSLGDVMPTYRWIIEGEENTIKPSIDYANAYYGGNSLKFLGDFKAGSESIIKLFSADLKVEENMEVRVAAKAQSELQLDLRIEFFDGESAVIKGDKALGEEWQQINYSLKGYENKEIKTISLVVSSKEDKKAALNIGELTIKNSQDNAEVIDVSNLKVDSVEFAEEDTIAGVHLSWDATASDDLKAYEIYRKNNDGTYSLLGTTLNNRFFINSLQRGEKMKESEFAVRAVNRDDVAGQIEETKMTWPDNTVPKAKFTASKTVVAPNEEITFINMSNKLSETFEWTFEGANVTTSTDENPTVSYAQEGKYTVKLVAKNEQGQDEVVIEEFITVTEKAKEGLVNLALNKATEASSFVNNNEAPQFAVDGDPTKKWCAVGPDQHNITIDLGDVKDIAMLKVYHAEAGGENADMNTEEYMLEVSTDGTNFETVLDVKRNSQGTTSDAFKLTSARYVRFTVLKPTQGSDSAARIYEIEVYGLE